MAGNMKAEVDARFNSATTLESWRHDNNVRTPNGKSALQFGHDVGVVETRDVYQRGL